MDSKLVIRHRGGSEAHAPGSSQELQQEIIRLGRGPDCDVQFDPNADRAVSTSHAEVRRTDGGVAIVDLDSRNGVFVNGTRIEKSQELAPGDLVRFGSDGPQFEVELQAGSDDPEFRTIERVAPPKAASPTPDAQPVRSNVAANIPPELQGKTSIGVNTLMNVVESTARRERQRTRRAMVPIVGLMATAVLIVVLVYWPKDNNPVQASEATWSEVVAQAEQSIYVFLEERDGIFTGQGTAWSIGDGKLATNAHVANIFLAAKQAKEDDKQFVVRSCSRPPVDLRISEVKIHPKYDPHRRLSQRYNPFVPGQGFLLDVPSAYDVAVLIVDPRDADKLAPALPIAPQETLVSIAKGQEVALLGYPMEGQAARGGDLTKPSPQLRDGTVTRATNYRLANVDPKDAVLVGLGLSSAGGASGSPILNKQGEVIALNSAGDYKWITNNGVRTRVKSGGGAYGQRADVMRNFLAAEDSTGSLMSGLFGANQPTDVEEQLETQFLEMFQRGTKDPDAMARWLARDCVKELENEELGDPWITEHKITKAGTKGLKTIDRRNLKAKVYVRVVLPLERPVVPAVVTFNGDKSELSRPRSYFELARWTTTSGLTMKTLVGVIGAEALNEPVTVKCYWFPVRKR